MARKSTPARVAYLEQRRARRIASRTDAGLYASESGQLFRRDSFATDIIRALKKRRRNLNRHQDVQLAATQRQKKLLKAATDAFTTQIERMERALVASALNVADGIDRTSQVALCLEAALSACQRTKSGYGVSGPIKAALKLISGPDKDSTGG